MHVSQGNEVLTGKYRNRVQRKHFKYASLSQDGAEGAFLRQLISYNDRFAFYFFPVLFPIKLITHSPKRQVSLT
jgi:hypothetical protein